jgi:CDP-diacylglycerol--glycerol-3-phosphate 3-phosphatidyltransferase
MINERLQEWGRVQARKIAGWLRWTGLTPNALTLIGLLLNFVVAVVLARGYLLIGGILVLVAGLFDLLDGAMAKITDMVTPFGSFFDSTLDRYSEAAVFCGLQLAFLRELWGADRPEPAWPAATGAILCYLVLVGSLMISYTRARAEGLGLDCEVGWLQRPERIIVLGVGLLLPRPILLAVLVALAVVTQITVLQRIAHVRRLTDEQGR